MNKPRTIYRIISLSLSALILLTSVGILINIHYCGDEVAGIGVYAKAPQCDLQAQAFTAVSLSDSDQLSQRSCCSNDLIFSKLNVENENLSTDINFSFSLAEPIRHSKFVLVRSEDFKVVSVTESVPRIIDRNSLYQSFLI